MSNALTPSAASGTTAATRIGPRDFYVSIPRAKSVDFATHVGTLATLEGEVRYEPGDAIMTGTRGEKWPIERHKFESKYQPCMGTVAGQPGEYMNRQMVVKAIQLHADTVVDLPDRRGTLEGHAGDWLVEFDPHDKAIVAHDIFPDTYRLISVPVNIGLSKAAAGVRPEVDAVVTKIGSLLLNTRFQVQMVDTDGPDSKVNMQCLWCLIQEHAVDPEGPIPSVLTLSAAAFTARYEDSHSPIDILQDLKSREGHPKITYLRELLDQLKEAFLPRSEYVEREYERELHSVRALAEQWFELDSFNAKLVGFYQGRIPVNEDYYMRPLSDPAAHDDERPLWEAGAVADGVASDCQTKWQRSVLGVTKDLLRRKGLISIFLGNAGGLVQLGLIAAFALVCFTELHDGCMTEDYLSFLQCDDDRWRNLAGPLILLAYLIFLGIAWVKYLAIKAERVENKHQDYRLLAEYLRIQYLWGVLGIDEHVADDEPPSAPSGSGWVASALRALTYHTARPQGIKGSLSEARRVWARYDFLDAQIDYHRDKLIQRREKAIRCVRRCGRRALMLSLVAFLILLTGVIGFPILQSARPSLHWTHHSFDFINHFIVISMVMPLAIWAAMHKAIELYAWELEAQRGKLVLSNLLTAFEELKKLKERGHDEARLRSIYAECGHFFARDQAGWHALRRAKSIEAPGG